MTPRRPVLFLVACLLAVPAAHAAGPAVAPRKSPPAPSPARPIVIPAIVVNEALLDRLSTRPVPLPGNLSPAQRNGLDAVARHLKAGNMGAAQAQWRTTLASYVSMNTAGSDILAMMYFVMKESIVQQNEDKKYYLQKLKHYNAISDALRKHLRELAEASRNLAEKEKDARVSGTGRGNIPTVDMSTIAVSPPGPDPGTDNTLRWTRRRMDRGALEEQIRNVKRRLAAVGDDAQLANIDLQNKLQQQQQTLQTMSNVSKMLHDTAMSIIRKIG